jgi:hypothetical protein
MGFVQDDFSLGTIVGNNVMVDGVDKGDVVQPGHFRNQAGTAEAFDLKTHTYAEAYDVIDNTAGATLTSCGHGAGAEQNGGAVRLDDDTKYAGFGAGTGVPAGVGAPYPTNLPAPTANITVHLHHCRSASDPDEAGPKISVVASLQADLAGGTGTATVTGHVGETAPAELLAEQSTTGGSEAPLCDVDSVGGIVELPDIDTASLDRTHSSGPIVVLMALVVLGTVALSAFRTRSG